MTQIEFNEYLDALQNRVGWLDCQYACEVWDSMTETEKKECTPERMNAYIEDTYLAVSEMEETI
jgi:hypothetical protein